jgi:GNAT superfamily N-acetyltransferase
MNTALQQPKAAACKHNLTISPARLEHMTDVVDIISSSAKWYEGFVDPKDMTEHHVDAEWARENFTKRDFYVARVDDQIVGTITLQEVNDAYIHLEYEYQQTEHVGQGYGGMKLDWAAKEARRRGKKALVLIAHPEADWAIRAYEKFGFKRVFTDKKDILNWCDGWMKPYYEEGFHFYQYDV